jgi:hypothetical protein
VRPALLDRTLDMCSGRSCRAWPSRSAHKRIKTALVQTAYRWFPLANTEKIVLALLASADFFEGLLS